MAKDNYSLKEAFEIISKHIKELSESQIAKGAAGAGAPSAPKSATTGSGAGLHTRDKSGIKPVGKAPTMANAFDSLNKEESSGSGSKSGMEKTEGSVSQSSSSSSSGSSMEKMEGSVSQSSSSSSSGSSMEKMEGSMSQSSKSESSSSSSKSGEISKMEPDMGGQADGGGM